MKVNIDDVLNLCDELGLVKSNDEDGSDLYDSTIEKICDDPEAFLVEYTAALLDHIQVGTSALNKKSYVGFGKRVSDDNPSIRMILKKSL